jgi:hemophore-related protein
MYTALLGSALSLVAPVMILPTASAAPAPCSASAMAAASGSVSSSVSSYLDNHPDVNQALTDIIAQPPIQARTSFRSYFNDHPDVANDLRGLRGPLNALDGCGYQISPSQLAAALQSL